MAVVEETRDRRADIVVFIVVFLVVVVVVGLLGLER